MKTAFVMPIEIISEANNRDHWAKKHKRAKNQKGLAYAYCLKYLGYPRGKSDLRKKWRITLVRIKAKGQRRYDGDNLQSGFKAIRDGIAMYLDIDDGSDRLDWIYEQEKGGDERGSVRVEIE